MESQAVFQAKIQAKFFSIESPPGLRDDVAHAVFLQVRPRVVLKEQSSPHSQMLLLHKQGWGVS